MAGSESSAALPGSLVYRAYRLLTCPLRGEARVTSSGLLIPEIDGLRFFCIMSVLLFHASPFGPRPGALVATSTLDRALEMSLGRGGAGVGLFFGISGFVLGMPFFEHFRHGRPKPTWGAYLSRRVLRIEPPYFICLVLLFAARATQGLSPDAWRHLLASGAYVHNLVYGEASTINVVAWSLEVEVQFYLVAPLLSRVFAIPGRGARRAVILALCVAPFALPWLGWSDRWIELTLPGQLPFFMAGFLALDLYDAWRSGPRARSVGWDLAGVLPWVLVVIDPVAWTRLYVVVAACLLSLVAAFRGPMLSKVVRSPPIVGIGGMCYTIYLYHATLRKPLDPLVAHVNPSGLAWLDAIARLTLVVGPSLFACTVLFLLFERPFMVRNWHQAWGAVLRDPSRWSARLQGVIRGEPPG